MGFGTSASHIIFFIAIVGLALGLVIVLKGVVDTTADSMVIQQKRMSNELETDITIEVVSYNSTYNNTSIFVKNTGKSKLDIDWVDVYIGGTRIPRNITNRTIEVLADTEITNTGTWDPKEQVKIVVINHELVEDTTYDIIVLTQYGIKDTEELST